MGWAWQRTTPLWTATNESRFRRYGLPWTERPPCPSHDPMTRYWLKLDGIPWKNPAAATALPDLPLVGSAPSAKNTVVIVFQFGQANIRPARYINVHLLF